MIVQGHEIGRPSLLHFSAVVESSLQARQAHSKMKARSAARRRLARRKKAGNSADQGGLNKRARWRLYTGALFT